MYLVVIAGEGKIWCQTNSSLRTVSCAILSDSLCQSCLAGVSAGGRRGLSGGDFSLRMTHPVASEPFLDGALRLAENTWLAEFSRGLSFPTTESLCHCDVMLAPIIKCSRACF